MKAVVQYLSPEWMSRAGAIIGEDEALAEAVKAADPGEGVTVVYVVRGVPEAIADANGQVTYSIHFSSRYGAVFSSPAASTPTAKEDTVILTLDYETACAINREETNPAVAIALGKVKVRGAAGKLLPLKEAFERVPEALDELRRDTQY